MTGRGDGWRRIGPLAAVFGAGAVLGAMATAAVNLSGSVDPADVLLIGEVDLVGRNEFDSTADLVVQVFNNSDSGIAVAGATLHPWPVGSTEPVIVGGREWTEVRIAPAVDCDTPVTPQLDLVIDGERGETVEFALPDPTWTRSWFCPDEHDGVHHPFSIETLDVAVGVEEVTTELRVVFENPVRDDTLTISALTSETGLLAVTSPDVPMVVPADGTTFTVHWTIDTCLPPGDVWEIYLSLLADGRYVGEWWAEPDVLAAFGRFVGTQCERP